MGFSEEELKAQLLKKIKSPEEVGRMSFDERLEYELSLAIERDLLSALDAKFEEGKEEALKIIARKMKQSGMSLSEIAEITGLTLEEVENL